jgi:chondroitin 4-sulfotransferase 11
MRNLKIMLLSRSKKFLFIHIQKTGGQSLERVLKREIPDTHRFLGTHDHASWARHKLEPEWSEYFKFALVRNPWDRLVSWYMMIEQNKQLIPWYKRLLRRNKYNLLWQYVLERSKNFEEFIINCTGEVNDMDGRKSFAYNQLDYLTDEEGKVIVDFIGRFEKLELDAEIIFRKLGVENAALPHINQTPHKHYSEYYSDKTMNIVAERYSRDIEFFGYKFE